MGEYDTTIRTILNEGCSAFLGKLGVPSTVEPLPVKLPRVTAREVDYVARDPATGIIHHVEFQVGNDPLMAARMLIYAGQIGERAMADEIDRLRVAGKRRGRASRKVVFPEISSNLVYIGREKMAMPASITTTALKFGYAATDVRTLKTSDLLASPALGDAIMAILCEGGGSRDTVRSILSRLKGLEQHALNRAYGKLVTLASLRKVSGVVETEARAMNIHIDLDEINSVREHSERKARAARLELLGDMIAAKFGLPPKDVGARLTDLGDDEIKAIALRLVDASSFDELLTPSGNPKP